MTQLEQQLTIIEKPDVSINDLIQIQADGISVLRSAHVGNLSPYNLALAQSGVRILLVDHNITGKDKNYFPELAASTTGTERLVRDGLLSSRTVLDTGDTKDARYLDQFHIRTIEKAIPNSQLITNTDYVRKHDAIANEVLSISAACMPELFTRIVTADGSTKHVDDGTRRLQEKGALQLADDPRTVDGAVLIPNAVDIVLNFLIEALDSGEAVQYHLSGPAMVQYVLKQKEPMLPVLQMLYSDIVSKASFGSKLPDCLLVNLVPTAEAKFATTSARQPQLDNLLAVIAAGESGKQLLAAARASFFKEDACTDPRERQTLEDLQRSEQARLVGAIALAAEATPEHFTEPRSTGFITQYDVLNEGGLYVPSTNRTATMAALRALTVVIDNAVKKRRL